jgi:hypothetical protein
MRHFCTLRARAPGINDHQSVPNMISKMDGVKSDKDNGKQLVAMLSYGLIEVEIWLMHADADEYLRGMRHLCAMMRQLTIKDAPPMRHS